MSTPYPYQRKGVKYLNYFNGRALLADDMGLGKTPQILWWLNEDVLDRCPALIVCPASLKLNWQREALKHVGMQAQVIEGRHIPKWGKIDKKIVIINYDILKDWVDVLKEHNFQTIVFDECHYLKNRLALRTKTSRSLVKGVPYRIGVSGTPILNVPAEIWPMLNIIRPDLYTSFWDFASKYCAPTRTHWGWQYKGATHTKELNEELLDNLMIRRRKVDVLKQLPNKIRSVVPMDVENRKEYNQALHDFLSWMARNHSSKLSTAMRAERLVKLGYLRRLAALSKMKYVYEWVDNFLEQDPEEKIILFGIHKKVIQAIHERYKHISVVVDGSKSTAQRYEAFDAFNKTKTTRIFVGNIDAAGTGWSASSCPNVGFVELAWKPGLHTQAEDRCHGIGRGVEGVHTMCYYFIAYDTIEEKLCKIIQSKQEVASSVIDGQSDVENLNIHDILTENLKRGTP